jgi:hypothetical protein
MYIPTGTYLLYWNEFGRKQKEVNWGDPHQKQMDHQKIRGIYRRVNGSRIQEDKRIQLAQSFSDGSPVVVVVDMPGRVYVDHTRHAY